MTCSNKTTMRRARGALLVLAATVAVAAPATATILTFDQVRIGGNVVPTISGNDVPDGYGDRVTGPVVSVPGGQFTYGEAGEGFTPNVEVAYLAEVPVVRTSNVALWEGGYGTLQNVLFPGERTRMLQIELQAAPGVDVLLYGFDLAGWFQRDYTIDAVRVGNTSQVLFSDRNVLVHGAAGGPGRTSFVFTTPLTARFLAINIDYSNLDDQLHDNIGIDNIRFGQTRDDDTPGAPIPEPTGLALFGLALATWMTRRRASR